MNIFLINMAQGEWVNLVLLIPGSLEVHLKDTAASFVCAQDRSPHRQDPKGWGALFVVVTMFVHLH